MQVKRLATLAVALTALLLVFAPVAEQPAVAGDAEEYSAIDHVDVHVYEVPDADTFDDGFVPLSSGDCNKHHRGYQVDAYNHFGNNIWSFGGFLQDCTRNGNVVHKKWGACWGWTSNNILNRWEFKGCEIEAQSNQNLPRNYIWRQWRGHFKSCVYIAGCQTKNPWVYIGGRGDGTFGTNGGAG